MKVTSRDVARKAGVSQTTVSYVLNNTPGQTIPPRTREAVLRAARELEYTPHAGARALRSGRSDTVLLPMPGMEIGHIFAEMINACAIALADRKLTLVTDTTRYETPQAQIDAWLRLGPAALIDLMLRRDDPAHEALQRAGVSVLTGAHAAGPASQRPMDTVADRAREAQAQHMLDSGRRNLIAVIPASARAEYRSAGRVKGMRGTVRRAGGTLTIEEVELDRESMRAAVRAWRKRRPRPDGICAYNDQWGIGLLHALTTEGIRVPDDIAVMGIDDLPLSSVVVPALTSVTWPIAELGQAVAAATADLITGNGAATYEFTLPEVRVVVREST